MAMTSINVRVDENDKKWFDWFCGEIGVNMSTAIQMFVKATRREQKIPFDLKTDSYFTGVNMQYIMEGIHAYEQGVPGVVKTFEELEAMANA